MSLYSNGVVAGRDGPVRGPSKYAKMKFRPDEEWMELPEFPYILVSTKGRAYNSRRQRQIIPRKLTGHSTDNFYIQWAENKVLTRRSLGLAMLNAFGVEPPSPREDYMPGFKDGDSANLNLDNLVWVERWSHLTEHRRADDRQTIHYQTPRSGPQTLKVSMEAIQAAAAAVDAARMSSDDLARVVAHAVGVDPATVTVTQWGKRRFR